MERKPLLAGNWKMFKGPGATEEFAAAFRALWEKEGKKDREAAFLVPFIDLYAMKEALAGSGIGFGALADRPELGWNAVFFVAIVFGFIGTAILAALWNAPANGYERAERVLVEMDAEERKKF